MKAITRTGNQIIRSPHHHKPLFYDARYQANGSQKPLIIFVHGFKGFKDWGTFNLLADRFAEEGFVFIKLNLSHNGTTPEQPIDLTDLEAFGHNNFSLELDDLGVLIDHLQSNTSPLPREEADLERLALIGHSRGGGLVLLKAAEEARVKAVVTWAAIHNLEERWPQSFLNDWKDKGVVYIENTRTKQQLPLYYQLVEDFWKNKERLDIPAAVKKLDKPLLIIHGNADETLPLQMAHELASWKHDAELLVLEGSNHTFGGTHPWQQNHLPADTVRVLEATTDFLKKHFT